MKKYFLSLVMFGLMNAMAANSFAGVVIRDSNGKSDHLLRADTKAGVMYFQKCNLDGNGCVPFDDQNGYPMAKINKIQQRVLVSKIVDVTGGTIILGGTTAMLVGLGTLGIFAPPVGALTIAGYLGMAGGGFIIIGGGHDLYKGFKADARMSNTLKIGQKGEDHAITVPSMADYETDLTSFLNK